MPLKANTIFANRYELIRLLGRGGFAEVWLVKDTLVGLDEALKVYAPGGGMDEDGLKVFAQELSVVHDLRHTNLLTPKGIGNFENQPYLILPYCPNGSLKRKVGYCTETEAWKILRQVASGLAYLHEQGIVHQDIKPDNILLDANNNYVITDFGISLKVQSTLRKSMHIQANSGTMAYMAPERFSAKPHPIPANDIWSLGAMMFELIEGEVPFVGMAGLAQKNGAEMPEIEAPISEELRQSIQQMLASDPHERPTAEQLAKGNSQIVSSEKSEQKTQLIDRTRLTQPIKQDEASKGIQSTPPKKQPHGGYWIIMILLIAGLVAFVMSRHHKIDLGEQNQEPTAERVETIGIDRQRIEQIISNYCKNSSKGGDYSALKNYFTTTISPHPSKEIRYNTTIGETTKKYVERFPEYKISTPFNIQYINSSFPLTVKCDIQVMWVKNDVRKRAWIHKTFYFTSDYKISGYEDEEYRREVL